MNTNKVYKAMKLYRINFLVIELILIVLFALYITSAYPYIVNIFEGAVAFDESYYSENAEVIEVGEKFELHRTDEINIPDFALKDSSYWQGSKYEFVVPIKDVKALDITYTNAETGTGTETNLDDVSAQLFLSKIGGKDTLVLAYPHQDLTKMSEVTGIFTAMPYIVYYDITQNSKFSPKDEVSAYMLDIRGLEMESEFFDFFINAILLALIIFLGIKLCMQFKDYRCTPTFRQLEKYGVPDEIAKEVDEEMKDKKWVKGECETETYIVSKDAFKLKIIKNFRKHGQFEYYKK